MSNHKLDSGTVLINKYTQIEVQILDFNEDKNWYDAVRTTDGKSIAIGVNWSNFYTLKGEAV